MRSTRQLSPPTDKLGYVGLLGATHALVELWRLEAASGRLGLLGHYPTVFAAQEVAAGEPPGSCFFTTGPGRLLLRLETGCH